MSKIFDDFNVECNECEHYWNAVCDGVKPNDTRSCTSFKATRQVDIPKQIEKLDTDVKDLKKAYIWLSLMILIHLVCHLIF